MVTSDKTKGKGTMSRSPLMHRPDSRMREVKREEGWKMGNDRVPGGKRRLATCCKSMSRIV